MNEEKKFLLVAGVIMVAVLAFATWAMLGPCSKPIMEAPAWCVAR